MDNERPRQVSILKDFVGLHSDADPMDIPEGAMSEQMNMFSLRTGELTTRGGLQEVTVTFLE